MKVFVNMTEVRVSHTQNQGERGLHNLQNKEVCKCLQRVGGKRGALHIKEQSWHQAGWIYSGKTWAGKCRRVWAMEIPDPVSWGQLTEALVAISSLKLGSGSIYTTTKHPCL